MIGAVAIQPAIQDRRDGPRYEIAMSLRYTARSRNKILLTGAGESINISSNGLLLRSSMNLLPGDSVLAALEWPVLSAAGEPLALCVSGYAVWSQGPITAVRISHYDFMSRKNYEERQPAVTLPAKYVFHRHRDRRIRAHRDKIAPHSVILVVETEEIHRLLSAMLGKYRCPVQHVTASEARQIVQAGQPSVRVLITNTLTEFADLEVSAPVIYMRAEGSAPDTLLASFTSIIPVDKPLIYDGLRSAIRNAWFSMETT
jgi:hypothetical protein